MAEPPIAPVTLAKGRAVEGSPRCTKPLSKHLKMCSKEKIPLLGSLPRNSFDLLTLMDSYFTLRKGQVAVDKGPWWHPLFLTPHLPCG